jgi:class 3 adenylate cyclase
VQDGYFTGAAQAIADHGGQVEKFIGDTVVATSASPTPATTIPNGPRPAAGRDRARGAAG